MTTAESGNNSGTPAPRTRLLLMQAAFCAAVLLYGTAGRIIGHGLPPGSAGIDFPGSEYLKAILLAISIILFPLLRKMQRDLHRKAGGGEAAGGYNRRLVKGYITLFSLAHSPALFGLLLHLLGHPPRTRMLLTGMALFYLVVMTPPSRLDGPRPA